MGMKIPILLNRRKNDMINFSNSKPPSVTQPATSPLTKISFGKAKSTEITPQPIIPAKPKSLFGDTDNDPKMVKAVAYLNEKYESVYIGNERPLKNMIKQLMDLDLNIISTWGEEVLIETKNVVTLSAEKIREFNSYNGNETLNEILNIANHQQSLMQKLTKSFSSNKVTYLNRVEALKIKLKSTFSVLVECNKICKSSVISKWLVTIAAVADTMNITDELVSEAIFNRRRLLQQSLQNIQVAQAQVEQVLGLIIKMQSEIDHIIDVVVPSMELAGK